MDESKRPNSNDSLELARKELDRYKYLIKDEEADTETYTQLVKYAEKLDLYHEASQALEKAIKKFPKEESFYIKLANIYYQAGRDDEAIMTYEMLMNVSSLKEKETAKLIELYTKNKRYKDLIQNFSKQEAFIKDFLGEVEDEEKDSVFRALCMVLQEDPSLDYIYIAIEDLIEKSKQRVLIAQNTFRWIIGHHIECEQAFKALYDLSLSSESYDQTVDDFFQTLKSMPSHEKAYYYLQLLLDQKKDYKLAVKVFSKLLKLSPQTKAFYLSLSEAYQKQGKLTDAVSVLKKQLRIHGNDDETIVAMAKNYLAQNKLDYTLNFIHKSYPKVDCQIALSRLQYEVYLKMDRKKAAIDFYKKMIKKYPDERFNYSSVYEISCELQDFLTAITVIPAEDDVINDFLEKVEKSETFDQHIELYAILLLRFPNNQIFYKQAIKLAQDQKNSTEAMFWMYRLLDMHSSDEDLWQEAYDLSITLNRDEDTLYLYRKAKSFSINLKGEFQDQALRLGEYVLVVEESEEEEAFFHDLYKKAREEEAFFSAMAILEICLQKYPKDVFAMHVLLEYYRDLKKLDKSLELCEKLSTDFDTPEQYLDWASLENHVGHLEKAISILEDCTEKLPPHLEVILLLIELYFQEKDISLSIKKSLPLQEMFPQESKIKFLIGNMYEKKGHMSKAMDFYSLAIELDPLHIDIYKKMLKITKENNNLDSLRDIAKKALFHFSNELEFYFDLGEVYIQKKEYSKAIDLYRDALKIAPGNEGCYAQLFSTYCLSEDFGNALRICPEDRKKLLELYDVCIEKNDHKMALETLKKATRLFPLDFELYQKLATIFYRLKEWLNVEKSLLKMKKIDPENRHVYVNLFALRCQVKHYEEAIDIYIQAHRRWPKDQDFTLKIAALHYKLKNYDKALDYYKLSLKIDRRKKVVFHKLGEIYKLLGRLNDAVILYKEAILRFPYEIEFYSKRAFLLEKMEDYSEAARVLKQGIQKKDSDIDLHVHLGEIYKKAGRYKECVACYKNAILLDEFNEKRHVALGKVYIYFEKEVEAMDLFKNLIHSWPMNKLAYKHLFDLYCLRRKYDYAEEYFKSLILIDEDSLEEINIIPYLYYFNILYIQKKYVDALRFLEKSLNKFSRNTSLIKRLAALYYKLGKPSESIIYFQRALDITPKDLDIYKYLFNVFFKGGRLKEAMRFYKKALSLSPETKKDFATLYKLCTKVEYDEEAFRKVTSILEDYHQEAF